MNVCGRKGPHPFLLTGYSPVQEYAIRACYVACIMQTGEQGYLNPRCITPGSCPTQECSDAMGVSKQEQFTVPYKARRWVQATNWQSGVVQIKQVGPVRQLTCKSIERQYNCCVVVALALIAKRQGRYESLVNSLRDLDEATQKQDFGLSMKNAALAAKLWGLDCGIGLWSADGDWAWYSPSGQHNIVNWPQAREAILMKIPYYQEAHAVAVEGVPRYWGNSTDGMCDPITTEELKQPVETRDFGTNPEDDPMPFVNTNTAMEESEGNSALMARVDVWMACLRQLRIPDHINTVELYLRKKLNVLIRWAKGQLIDNEDIWLHKMIRDIPLILPDEFVRHSAFVLHGTLTQIRPLPFQTALQSWISKFKSKKPVDAIGEPLSDVVFHLSSGIMLPSLAYMAQNNPRNWLSRKILDTSIYWGGRNADTNRRYVQLVPRMQPVFEPDLVVPTVRTWWVFPDGTRIQRFPIIHYQHTGDRIYYWEKCQQEFQYKGVPCDGYYPVTSMVRFGVETNFQAYQPVPEVAWHFRDDVPPDVLFKRDATLKVCTLKYFNNGKVETCQIEDSDYRKISKLLDGKDRMAAGVRVLRSLLQMEKLPYEMCSAISACVINDSNFLFKARTNRKRSKGVAVDSCVRDHDKLCNHCGFHAPIGKYRWVDGICEGCQRAATEQGIKDPELLVTECGYGLTHFSAPIMIAPCIAIEKPKPQRDDAEVKIRETTERKSGKGYQIYGPFNPNVIPTVFGGNQVNEQKAVETRVTAQCKYKPRRNWYEKMFCLTTQAGVLPEFQISPLEVVTLMDLHLMGAPPSLIARVSRFHSIPSAGVSWISKFPKERRLALIRGWCDYKDGLVTKHIFKTFVKREFSACYSSVGTVIPGNPRAIQPPREWTHCATGPWFIPLLESLKGHWSVTNPIYYCGGSSPEQLDMWINSLADENGQLRSPGWLLETDFSMFDCSISEEYLDMLRIWYKRNGLGGRDFDDAILAWKKPRGCTPHGVSYKTGAMNASGRDDTALLNGLCNALVQITALTMLYKNKEDIDQITPTDMQEVMHYVRIAIMGDDSLIYISKRFPTFPMAQYERLVSYFGLEAKTKLHTNAWCATFLGGHPYPVQGGLQWGPTPGRHLYKAGCALDQESNSLPKWLDAVTRAQIITSSHVPLIHELSRATQRVLREREVVHSTVLSPKINVWMNRTRNLHMELHRAEEYLWFVYGISHQEIEEFRELVLQIRSVPVAIRCDALDKVCFQDDK